MDDEGTAAAGESTGPERAHEALRRLLEQADDAAAAVVEEAAEVRRHHEQALVQDRAEIDELRRAMTERLEAADDRLAAAERVVETSRRHLREIDVLRLESNRTHADAVERATALVAGVDAEIEAMRARAQGEADMVVRNAQIEAQRILADAAVYRREAEQRAADALGSAHVRVEEVIQRATARRHAEIAELRAHEHEVTHRIQSLLASVAPTDLGVVPARRGDTEDPAIDLTDGVGDAIRRVIDDWSPRSSEA